MAIREVLEIGSFVGGIVSGASILVQFIQFVFKKGSRIFWHGFYLSIVILIVSFGYFFAVAPAYKKIDALMDQANKKIGALHEYVVDPYLTPFVRGISKAREDSQIMKCRLGDSCTMKEYPEEILNQCRVLSDLEEKGVRLIPEGYYELGLLAYYKEDYDTAIRYGKLAVARRTYYTDALHLISVSFRHMGQLDSAEHYSQKIEGRW